MMLDNKRQYRTKHNLGITMMLDNKRQYRTKHNLVRNAARKT
ncbi:unnamed protein product [Ectocarpus sp. CCAP 1310/34]|nr:unnamed protein product [Ectocarpus sp. CCAP 1310/34]